MLVSKFNESNTEIIKKEIVLGHFIIKVGIVHSMAVNYLSATQFIKTLEYVFLPSYGK